MSDSAPRRTTKSLDTVKAPEQTMESVVVQMMSLSGPDLRKVFDDAIVKYRTSKDEAEADFSDRRATIIASINENNALIQELETKVQSQYADIESLDVEEEQRVKELDEQKALIDNLMNLFRARMDGLS